MVARVISRLPLDTYHCLLQIISDYQRRRVCNPLNEGQPVANRRRPTVQATTISSLASLPPFRLNFLHHHRDKYRLLEKVCQVPQPQS